MADRILVFIPAYQCARQIPRVLAAFTAPDVAAYFTEVLVLDNGSRDDTIAAAQQAAEKITTLPVVIGHNRENYGLGGSHKSAFSYARRAGFTHVVVLHGDDQGDIRDLLPILAAGQHRTHACCLGARFMKGSRLKGYSLIRIIGNHIFNMLFSLAARKRMLDLGSGLNIYSTPFVSENFYHSYADNLTFNCYMLLGTVARKARMRFFPISWREDDQISNVRLLRQCMQTLSIVAGYALKGATYLGREHREKPHDTYQFDTVWKNR